MFAALANTQLLSAGQYTLGVATALVYIITSACPTVSAKDLEGFPDQAPWQLVCTAREKREYVVRNLPDAIRLSRYELFAIPWGWRSAPPTYPRAASLLNWQASRMAR